jgi:hypothetical protein
MFLFMGYCLQPSIPLRWLKEGVLPTTEKVCILKHGDGVSRSHQIDAFGDTHEDVEELRLPVPWLKDLAIVDTPVKTARG